MEVAERVRTNGVVKEINNCLPKPLYLNSEGTEMVRTPRGRAITDFVEVEYGGIIHIICRIGRNP